MAGPLEPGAEIEPHRTGADNCYVHDKRAPSCSGWCQKIIMPAPSYPLSVHDVITLLSSEETVNQVKRYTSLWSLVNSPASASA